MPDNGMELRRIAWTQIFPFLRLFRAFKSALNPSRLALALACVIACYGIGRLMDLMWRSHGALVSPATGRGATEIEVYATRGINDFNAWRNALLTAPQPPPAATGQPAPVPLFARHGPFIALLDYETRCFAAAIQGVCAGRWGIAGSALEAQPSLFGSIGSAIKGILWLCTQKPWFALFYGVLLLLIFALFGGAICRSAAVQSAREESIPLGEAVGFARQKYNQFVLAPAIPLAGFLVVFGIIAFLSMVGAIPYLGDLFAAFYVLGILGGVALTFLLLMTTLSFHLMWPTIAAEASDALDAISRSIHFMIARIPKAIFYAVALLIYGGLGFVGVRLAATLLLKLTHSATKTGMFGKLGHMWHMPAWNELALLPTTGDPPFWGTFHGMPLHPYTANLSGWEPLGTWLIASWVYLVVALVGAFVISFYFCASTEMYFLLRRDVDAVDYEEVFYDEPETDPAAGEPATAAPPAQAVAETQSKGTSLPVIGGARPPEGPPAH